MPQPTSTSLHISVPLTNISIAYQQDLTGYVADRVFPLVGVEKQFNSFNRYKRGDWYRTVATRRAPGTETPGSGWRVDQDVYACHVYGVHKDIDDQTRANADNQFNLDRDATQFVTNDLLLSREKNWVESYFKAGVWTDMSGISGANDFASLDFQKFSVSGTDPIKTVGGLNIFMQGGTGYRFNTIVVTPELHLEIVNHPSIIDRIKYTQGGFVSEQLIARAFGVERYMVVGGIMNTANEKSSGDDETMQWIHNVGGATDAMLLCYVNPNPGLLQVSAGYTFGWTGLLGGSAYATRIKKFRFEAIASDRVEGEMAYDQKVIAPDLGILLTDVL